MMKTHRDMSSGANQNNVSRKSIMATTPKKPEPKKDEKKPAAKSEAKPAAKGGCGCSKGGKK